MYCASRIYTFQQLAWQQFIKHSITNIFWKCRNRGVVFNWISNMIFKCLQRPEATVTSYVAHHGEQWQPSEDRQRRDKEPDNGVQSITSQQTHVWFFSTARNLPSERAPETPLLTKDKQNILIMPLCAQQLYWKPKKPNTEKTEKFDRWIDVLLTVREGATAHSLIKDRHKEHVAIFKIRFHFINGLDPGKERNTTLIPNREAMATDLEFRARQQIEYFL